MCLAQFKSFNLRFIQALQFPHDTGTMPAVQMGKLRHSSLAPEPHTEPSRDEQTRSTEKELAAGHFLSSMILAILRNREKKSQRGSNWRKHRLRVRVTQTWVEFQFCHLHKSCSKPLLSQWQ